MNKNHLLDQRTIVVTGAATGIGQAFAIGCAAQGAKVVAADMNPADETLAAIEAVGGQALAVRVDVADEAGLRQVGGLLGMGRAGEQHGQDGRQPDHLAPQQEWNTPSRSQPCQPQQPTQPAAPTEQAPAAAIAHLKQHPELADAFKSKYGYLP